MSATVRIEALELLLKQHLNLSEGQLQAALEEASEKHPFDLANAPEPYDQLISFLSGATKPPSQHGF